MATDIVQALIGPSLADMANGFAVMIQRRQEELARRPLGARQKRLLARMRRSKRPILLSGSDVRVAQSLAARGLVFESEKLAFEVAR